MSLPLGSYAQIAPSSRLATKSFIDIGTGIVYLGYWDKIKVVLFNHTSEDFTVQASDRIAQLILERIKTPQVKNVATLDDTDCGVGGFGSIVIKPLAHYPHSKYKKGRKKKNSLSPTPSSQLQQAQNSCNMVVSVGPGPSSLSWLA